MTAEGARFPVVTGIGIVAAPGFGVEDIWRAIEKGESGLSPAHQEELDRAVEEFDRLRNQLVGFQQELAGLGVELKDPFSGLIDFPCWKDGREVYLCWMLDEPEVAHWHELTAGFAGRQQLLQDVAR